MQDRLETVLRDAQQIAGSPEEHLDSPHLCTTAWATLKAARGQGFDPARLRAAHLVERPAPSPEPTEQVLERVGHVDLAPARPNRRAARGQAGIFRHGPVVGPLAVEEQVAFLLAARYDFGRFAPLHEAAARVINATGLPMIRP